MSSLRSFIRTLAIAAACGFITVPLAANAADKPQAPHGEKAGKHHDDKVQFPLDPAKFNEMVEHKIEHVRTKMEAILTKNSVPDSVKTQVRKDFDAVAAKVRTAAKEAGKDGKVTKDEAHDVRQQAKGFVKQLHEKYGQDKDKKEAKRHRKHRAKNA